MPKVTNAKGTPTQLPSGRLLQAYEGPVSEPSGDDNAKAALDDLAASGRIVIGVPSKPSEDK
jgi:hypothetical protein